MTNAAIKVKRSRKTKKSSTDIQMLIESNSEQQYDIFDKQVIVNSLTKECNISEHEALSIASRVEETLLRSNFKQVSSSYIRSLINQILGESGYDAWLKYSSLSIPVYDVKQMIEEKNKENSNSCFSPAAIDSNLGDIIQQQYALREVYNPETATAHKLGELHLHDLAKFSRPYCSGNSVGYVALNGLRLPGIAHSKPASHALTLVNHLQCFFSFLRTQFCGAIGGDGINIFFAPYLEGMNKEELKQTAQHLIFSFAQLASGNDVCFSDFNLYTDVPKHLKNSPAIGKHGKYTGKTYGEYEQISKDFLMAILDVAMEGDANGANFPFPKLDIHISESSFEKKNEDVMNKICELNSKRGSAYIIYDRGEGVKISECCRLQLTISGDELTRMIEHPEEARFSAWANITLNLPRIAYKYKKMADVYKEIDRLVELAMRGHKDKYNYICKLLDIQNGPLAFLAKGMDGKPYLRREEAKFLIGMVGLNEMVKILTGFEMHEKEEAFTLGVKIIAYLNKSVEAISSKHSITAIIEETPAESTSGKLAILDVKRFPEAIQFVKGDIRTMEIYYTNSVHFAYNAQLDILTRIRKQSKFAPMIQAGSIIHNWMGEHEPDPQSLKKMYEYTLKNTQAAQTSDSPDMTVCKNCHKMFKGFHDVCPQCGSDNIYQETKITGYFSKTSGWSKGKLAELKDRLRVDFKMPLTEINNDGQEKILFFSKHNCPKCEVVKNQLLTKPEVVEKLSIVDIQTFDGLALACYYNVDKLPAILKVKGEEVISRLDQEGSFLKWVKENTK